jgi:hypothetical protein
MLETHIVMSSLIFCLVLVLMFRLAFTLGFRLTLFHVLYLALFLVLCLSSLVDLTIAHIVLVHERTVFSLDALVVAHVLIVVIVSCVGLIFSVGGSFTHLELTHLDGPRFPIMVHVPLDQVMKCKGL